MVLTYLSLKCVLEFVDANKRIEMVSRIPSLREIEKKSPLHLNSLHFTSNGVTLNETLWQLTTVLPGEGAPFETHGVPYGVDEFGRRDRMMDLELLEGDVQGNKNSIHEASEISNVDRLIPSFIQLTISTRGVPILRRPIRIEDPFHVALKKLHSFLLGGRGIVTTKEMGIDPKHNTILRVPPNLKIRCQRLNSGTFNYIKLKTILVSHQILEEHAVEISGRRTLQLSGNAKTVKIQNGLSKRDVPDLPNRKVIWEETEFTGEHIRFAIGEWRHTAAQIGTCHLFQLDSWIELINLFNELEGFDTVTIRNPDERLIHAIKLPYTETADLLIRVDYTYSKDPEDVIFSLQIVPLDFSIPIEEDFRRIHITARNPSLRKFNRSIPYHIKEIRLGYKSIQINHIAYSLTIDKEYGRRRDENELLDLMNYNIKVSSDHFETNGQGISLKMNKNEAIRRLSRMLAGSIHVERLLVLSPVYEGLKFKARKIFSTNLDSDLLMIDKSCLPLKEISVLTLPESVENEALKTAKKIIIYRLSNDDFEKVNSLKNENIVLRGPFSTDDVVQFVHDWLVNRREIGSRLRIGCEELTETVEEIKRIFNPYPLELIEVFKIRCVLEYMEANKRMHITARNPSLRKSNRSIPYHIKEIEITYQSVTINNVFYYITPMVREIARKRPSRNGNSFLKVITYEIRISSNSFKNMGKEILFKTEDKKRAIQWMSNLIMGNIHVENLKVYDSIFHGYGLKFKTQRLLTVDLQVDHKLIDSSSHPLKEISVGWPWKFIDKDGYNALQLTKKLKFNFVTVNSYEVWKKLNHGDLVLTGYVPSQIAVKFVQDWKENRKEVGSRLQISCYKLNETVNAIKETFNPESLAFREKDKSTHGASDPRIPDERRLLIYEKVIREMQKDQKDYCSGYCRRPETRHIDCGRILKGDRSYIPSVTGINRVPLVPNPFLNMSCAAISSRITPKLPMKPLSQGGIAFARTIYKDYEFIEKMVQMTWHPENRFCFVVDLKAKDSFKEQIKKLVECFPNQMVLLPITLDLDSAGHNQNLAHTQCMKALLLHSNWSYLMLLQNHDITTKTVYEMDQVFEALGGANDVYTAPENEERRREDQKWDPESLKLFRNETQIPVEVLREPLTLSSGSAEATLSRAAVKWLVETVNLSKFLEQQNDLEYGGDEQFIPTFQLNAQLGMPGHFTKQCPNPLQITRMARFAFRNSSKCATKTVCHNACLFGVEDMKAMAELPYLVWNKVYPVFDWAVTECTAELLFNRTFLEQKEPLFDLDYYKQLVTVG
uniref:Protein kinase domain-containing protein n=1 Tax=Caenorhabditis tropicalis TaxID=1561998 RepID=A0A1I7UGN0_9PELO